MNDIFLKKLHLLQKTDFGAAKVQFSKRTIKIKQKHFVAFLVKYGLQ